eukprot:2136350-Prymnesium_polylepis.1
MPPAPHAARPAPCAAARLARAAVRARLDACRGLWRVHVAVRARVGNQRQRDRDDPRAGVGDDAALPRRGRRRAAGAPRRPSRRGGPRAAQAAAHAHGDDAPAAGGQRALCAHDGQLRGRAALRRHVVAACKGRRLCPLRCVVALHGLECDRGDYW